MNSYVKVTSLVIVGNVLEYYDFLLFMHLGPIITPLFFPGYAPKQTHFFSLLLFGLAFITRPIGGYLFGRIADSKGRKAALVQSVKWSLLPAFGLAFLPTFETIGSISAYLFIFLRLFQGVALGGEYPNAGTYLFEYHKSRHGLISGILGASGTVGSIIGFSFAMLCSLESAPTWLWRVGFFLGGFGGLLSYNLRAYLADFSPPQQKSYQSILAIDLTKWALVIMIGTLVGTSLWLPMTYSNFYITKILNQPSFYGQQATLIALVGYIIFSPFWGLIADTTDHFRFMRRMAIAIIPASFISFMALASGNTVIAQICLICMAAAFGAPIHAVMNTLFPPQVRARAVALLFMSGLSVGGLAPSLAGYLVDRTGLQVIPAAIVSVIALLTAFLFYKIQTRPMAYAVDYTK